ncbi:MAG: hypothetical protein HAW63_00610 [Bdellovibrionaceae bacterium]|nr:hypothetical protein [Pseudobdellovibrionaceae bacterium]
MKILGLMALCIFLSSCGSSGRGSGIVLSAVSLSLGNPNNLKNNRDIGYHPQKIEKTFSWKNLLIEPVYAAVTPLVSNFFRGITKPNQGNFSSSVATQFRKEHYAALQTFQSKNHNGINYNTLLQLGISEEKRASAGLVFYGLWQNLWVKALEIKYKVYSSLPLKLKDDTEEKKSWIHASANEDIKTFVGWKQETNRMIVRTVFIQINSDGSTHKEAINAIINADSIDITSYKTGSNPQGEKRYTVTVVGKLRENRAELTARLIRPQWVTNIKTGAQSDNLKVITISGSVVGESSGRKTVNLKYDQCPLREETCINSAVSGNGRYIIEDGANGSIERNGGASSNTGSLDLPSFFDINEAFNLDFLNN